MGWIERLHGTIVGLDTAPLIYFIERRPVYLPLVRPFFVAVEHDDIHVVTSTLTLTEVLVHPYKCGNQHPAQQYSRILLHSRNSKTLPVSPEIAIEAARLRATHGLKTPDSIQLATALIGNATSILPKMHDFFQFPAWSRSFLTASKPIQDRFHARDLEASGLARASVEEHLAACDPLIPVAESIHYLNT